MMNKMEPRDGLTLPDAPRPQVTLGVTRGVVRLLWRMGFSPLTEFTLTSSRRVDVAGLDRQGRFLFVEVKSSAEDFRADGKWHAYRDFCDGFYFAVPPGFPNDILPADAGLIVADAHDGAILRSADEVPMNGNRRRKQTLNFARAAADRLVRGA
ncbi:MAG: MmcB family DNA repair protein [Rhodospirillales bacterium]|tara:strand:+ start:9430 stop:9891 length:462 start_codon:yes stop_codon:yes gene_type:complete